MTSTQHAAQHSRYPLSSYSSGDLRLPSLKDLNFYRPPPGNPQDSLPPHNGPPPSDITGSAPDHPRQAQWSRSNPPATVQGSMPPHSQHSQHPQQQQQQQQQHSPPLSAAHDMAASSVEYSKHDVVYARPSIPFSAQVAPVPGSVNIGPPARGDDAPPHSPVQARRTRPPSTNMSAPRDGRPSHNAYPTPYNSYPSNQPPPNSPYHQIPNQNQAPHSAATSPHEQPNHNIPVSNHPGYNGYQQQHYMQPRQPVHPHHTPHHQQPLTHQPPSHATPSQHVLHIHPTQTAPSQPSSQSSAPHPSSLLQPSHPSTQQTHHTSPHQSSHSHQSLSHQPQQLSNHPPHGNPYPSPNPAAHPPQSPWGQQAHSQQTHHQPLSAPTHTQQTQQQQQQQQQQQPVQQPSHPHHASHPPPPVPNHHQPNAVPPPTPQSLMQQPQQQPQQHQHQQQHQQHQQQQQHPPPTLQPPAQSQHHVPQHHQAQSSISHHPQHPPAQPSQQQQQQQLPFARTSSLVPPNDFRANHYPAAPAPDPERVPDRNDPMIEIVKHCNALYTFANHYANLQQSMPHMQPSSAELQDMSQKALQVLRLLEDFRRAHLPESERSKMSDSMHASPEDHRAPKRPWEDMAQEGAANGDSSAGDYPPGADKTQSTAEQDMQIIRNKRATSTAGANNSAGQAKSKYRKRSRATPPGKCHSCNIRETPEWRRGPDGARTLCNACGLHYAKLMRKRDKADPTGQTPRIDLETLRASARAAESADKSGSRSKHKNVVEPPSPVETKPNTQQHHQGSFQLINVMAQEPNPMPSDSNRAIPPPPVAQPPSQPTSSSLPVPPPPWATPAQPPPTSGPPPSSAPTSNHGRSYAPEHLQHQSFMRTSQHPSAQASSR